MKMKIVVLCALLAVVIAGPIAQNMQIAVSEVKQNGVEDLVIDVSRAFIDSLGDEGQLQVNLTLAVTQGVVMFNQQPVVVGLTQLQLTAALTLRNRFTSQVMSVRPVAVSVLVHVTEQFQGTSSILVVQETVIEVDGNQITEFEVQEVVINTDVNGNEVHRVVTTMAIAQSNLAGAVTTPSTATPSHMIMVDPPLDGSSSSSDSDSKSDSDSDSKSETDSDTNNTDDEDPEPSSHKKWCHKFGAWFHKQRLSVRILLVAAATFISFFALYCLLSCCLVLCCGRKKSRSVYLDNVKLHYVPINLNEDDLTKKSVV